MACYASISSSDGYVPFGTSSYHAATESLFCLNGTNLDLCFQDIRDFVDPMEDASPIPSPPANPGLFLHALYELDVSNYIKELRTEFMDCENLDSKQASLVASNTRTHSQVCLQQPLLAERHQGASVPAPFSSGYFLHRGWAPNDFKYDDDPTLLGDGVEKTDIGHSASQLHHLVWKERPEEQWLPSERVTCMGSCEAKHAWPGNVLQKAKHASPFGVYNTQCAYESGILHGEAFPLVVEANKALNSIKCALADSVYEPQGAKHCRPQANRRHSLSCERDCDEPSINSPIADEEACRADMKENEVSLIKDIIQKKQDVGNLFNRSVSLVDDRENSCTSDEQGEFLKSDFKERAAVVQRPKKSPRRGRRGSKSGVRKPRLYNFLREILADDAHRSCVEWVNHKEGSFKFIDSTKVAQLWGERKNKPNMKYENFARSLRTYITKGILKKPRNKLVYSFADPSKECLTDIPTCS